ncbi:MAG: hypothetical protein HYZ65_08840 [Burkholderiales bacterium]|nr:hypothetical protein [Burkholderiales bacterium]
MKSKNKIAIVGTALALMLAGCGGFVYTTVGGKVSGLTGGGTLTLHDDGNYRVSLSADGPFSFRVASNASYNISVLSQPSKVNCTVVNGSGHMNSEAPLDNIVVTCLPNVPVGGAVAGLATGTTVGLSDNGSFQSTLDANGAFVLPTYIVNGGAYAVTVSRQPAGQYCSVTNGTGTADINNLAASNNVVVNCIAAVPVAGTVTGLKTGSSVVLSNNGSDTLTVSAAGNFTFANSMLDGAAYAVTVTTQPSGQTCSVTNGSGTASLTNPAGASNIAVNCV